MNTEPREGFVPSRRRTLQLLAFAGLGMTAAACTDTSSSQANTGSTPQGHMVIPDPVTKLPTGKVKLSWMDSGDQKAAYFKELAVAYHKKHPDITIDYNGSSWSTVSEAIGTGLRSGNAPDVFALPASITLQSAITNGWVGAFDDVIPHFEEVKKRFPPGMLVNGVNIFHGKTYMMPMTGDARLGNLLLFNRDYAKKADLDLDNEVLTWDQLRAAAKKLTKQGNGKYYGLIAGLNVPGGLTGPANDMAAMSGVPGGLSDNLSLGMDWSTGEFSGFDNPLSEEIVELMLAMYRDGSYHPDSLSLDTLGARNRVPLGQAAIMFQGPWNITGWRRSNPSFNLGLNLPAVKDPHDIRPLSAPPGGSNSWVYHAKTKLGPVIGDIFSYWASPDGQTQWAVVDGAGDPAFDAAAAKHASMDALSRKALSFGQRYTAIRPEPAVRNPDVEQVYLNLVPAQPSFSDRVMGVVSKQSSKSVKQILKESKDAAEKSLDDAIKKAKSKGAKVSRDDFVFSDWDPRKPYTKLYEK